MRIDSVPDGRGVITRKPRQEIEKKFPKGEGFKEIFDREMRKFDGSGKEFREQDQKVY